jgi:two-component system LytT family response regulator
MEAVDYLLKPITFKRFSKSIDKYLKLNSTADTDHKNYLYIKANGKLLKIFHADILYAESLRDYMKIVTAGGSFITRLTMKALVDMVPPGTFVRIHRSFLINAFHVSSIQKNTLTIHQVEIPIGENFRENTRNLK